MSKPLRATIAALALSATAFMAGVAAAPAQPDITVAPCGVAQIANTVPGVCVDAHGNIVSK